LRCGAIARFAAVMDSISDAAKGGLPVLGICNGFQILCEAHLLPGGLTRNQHLHFRNRDQRLRIGSLASAWTNAFEADQEIVIRSRDGEGRFVADEKTLQQLEAEDRVIARYVGGQPQRFAARHRRHPQRSGQRGRPHAPPGARDRRVDRSVDGRVRLLRVLAQAPRRCPESGRAR
jgi:phosphoribosylformylglycinamidine (FGAM) synthase-like amidotransferase family enzyme